MRYSVAALVFVLVAAGFPDPRPAGAVKPFMEQFKAVYVKPNTADHTMKVFNAAVEKKGCTICHRGQPNKPSKGYNAYGAQFKKLLSKRDGQDARKIRAAITKVAQMKSDPEDPSSPTFGKRLGEGKLPVGEITVRSKDASK
jgi:hypothetical protein